jgi:glycosyltransferase involved in cell wall biosynthesis
MALAIDMVGTSLGSGTRTYNLNFCNYLNNEKLKEKIYIFVNKNFNDNLKYFNNNNIQYIIKPNFLENIFFRILWMQFLLPFELKMLKVNQLYSPMNFGPIFLKILNIKFILALHSNLPWVFFNSMPGNKLRNVLTKFIMEKSIFASDILIVDSKFAKNELVQILKIDKNKIKVIYLGIDSKYLNESKNDYYLENLNYKDYIISVLSCVRYHNIITLLKAFKLLKNDNHSNLKLVFVMQILDHNYFLEIESFVSKNFNEGEIIFLHNLNNNYLVNLYKKAKLYIFSSYCEVFGLTSLEAMSQGCPVMISNCSALPEINDKGATYFDPNNDLEIKEIMSKILLEPGFRNDLITAGRIQYKKYTWENTVKESLKILNI